MRLTRRAFTLAALASTVLPCSQLLAADDPKKDKGLEDNQGAIELLKSTDKAKRLAATQELFKRDRKVLDALKKAGARHMAEDGGSTINTKRIDAVYSLIAGFPTGKPQAQFLTDSFGIHVDKGVTREDMVEMGKRHGFVIEGFREDGCPNSYVKMRKGNDLQATLREILLTEKDVSSVNLNYYENSRTS